MSIYEFEQLDGKQKGEAVFVKGTFIDDRTDHKFRVQLYRLTNFYVEVFYDPEKNEVVRYRSFTRLDQLAPYLL